MTKSNQNYLKPFFSYYGGKWRSGLKYPSPLYSSIIEPFAGAAGYSTRYYHHQITLIDKDPIIVSIWKYLIQVSSAEILSLPLLGDDDCIEDLNIPQEAKWLMGFWVNAGASQPCKRPSKWMRSHLRNGSFWGESIRTRIASQVDKIRHWKIIEGSYEDFSIPKEKCTYFVDPPYKEAGKHYKHHSINYADLARWCKSLNGQVIVCEAQGADWLPFKYFGVVEGSRGKYRKGRGAEVIWTSPK